MSTTCVWIGFAKTLYFELFALKWLKCTLGIYKRSATTLINRQSLNMDSDKFVDYYKVLDCDRTASLEDLKKNYQRLVLTKHPDKMSGGDEHDCFLLIQKAWSVLRDPETRKQYDAELSCQEHSDLLLYDSISLEDMEFQESEKVYTYSCRCGGTYLLEAENFTTKVVIGCDECSFSIQVNS